jgi:hypothetical protein
MILYSVVEAISPTGSSGVLPTGASSGSADGSAVVGAAQVGVVA